MSEFQEQSMLRNQEGENLPKTGVPFSKTVYHGTVGDFEEYQQSPDSFGIFFTDSPSHADKFARLKAKDLSQRGLKDTPGGENIRPAIVHMSNPLVVDMKGAEFEYYSIQKMAEEAKESGHDGLVLRDIANFSPYDNTTSTSYIVFEPSQIKSKFSESNKAELKI